MTHPEVEPGKGNIRCTLSADELFQLLLGPDFVEWEGPALDSQQEHRPIPLKFIDPENLSQSGRAPLMALVESIRARRDELAAPYGMSAHLTYLDRLVSSSTRMAICTNPNLFSSDPSGPSVSMDQLAEAVTLILEHIPEAPHRALLSSYVRVTAEMDLTVPPFEAIANRDAIDFATARITQLAVALKTRDPDGWG